MKYIELDLFGSHILFLDSLGLAGRCRTAGERTASFYKGATAGRRICARHTSCQETTCKFPDPCFGTCGSEMIRNHPTWSYSHLLWLFLLWLCVVNLNNSQCLTCNEWYKTPPSLEVCCWVRRFYTLSLQLHFDFPRLETGCRMLPISADHKCIG